MDLWTLRPAASVRSTRGDRRPSVTEVLPELLIGEYPRPEDITWLKSAFGITAVHSLQDDLDLQIYGLDFTTLEQEYGQNAIKVVRTPIPDGSADALALHLGRALDDLKSLTDAGERVYLHCNAGLNRAPSVAIAFMHAHRGVPLEAALAHVKQRRACGPFMTTLEEYFGPRALKSGK